MMERRISAEVSGIDFDFIPAILAKSFHKILEKSYAHISIMKGDIPTLEEIVEALFLWMYDAKRVNMQLSGEGDLEGDAFSLSDVEVSEEEKELFVGDVVSILDRGGYFYFSEGEIVNSPIQNIW